MIPIDRAILEFCAKDFRRLKDLRAVFPGATLYRRAKRLVKIGWLERQGPLYRSTSTGLRNLSDNQEGRWDRLEQVYSPLGLIPTEEHRGLVELILAAVMVRQRPTRLDCHPFFVIFGDTFHWKSTLGIFVCHALGLDPAIHVVDCGSESGKSLFIRRTASGDVASERQLVNAPFLVLDEFLAADRAVRSALNPFLTGNLILPFENEQVTVRPVPLLTLNPRLQPTLEGQLGLSAPLIRRAIVANVNAVVLPDLTLSGGEAVSAAHTQGPIMIKAPTCDCEEHRNVIVDLLKAILKPEAHQRIGIDVVVNLCTGMSAMLADPIEAIAQVVQRIGLLSATVGWVRSGWEATMAQFGRPHTSASMSTLPEPPSSLNEGRKFEQEEEETDGMISLHLSPGRREPGLPSLHLSDELRGTLTWLAVETGRSLEETLTALIQHYLRWRQRPDTIASLHRTVALSQQLNLNRIEPSTLEEYLHARAALSRYGRTIEDVPEALRLIARLARLPETWDWARADQAIQSVGVLIAAGILPGDIEALLLAHERLKELGFDERTAQAVAEALDRAGATGRRRSRVLAVLTTLAGTHVDLHDAEAEQEHVQQDLVRLEAGRRSLMETIEELKTSVAGLHQEQRDLHVRLAQMDTEIATCQSRFDLLDTFESYVQGNRQVIDAAGDIFDQIRALASTATQPGGGDSAILVADLHEKILEVLARHYGKAGRAA
jgi:hypothetical protein